MLPSSSQSCSPENAAIDVMMKRKPENIVAYTMNLNRPRKKPSVLSMLFKLGNLSFHLMIFLLRIAMTTLITMNKTTAMIAVSSKSPLLRAISSNADSPWNIEDNGPAIPNHLSSSNANGLAITTEIIIIMNVETKSRMPRKKPTYIPTRANVSISTTTITSTTIISYINYCRICQTLY